MGGIFSKVSKTLVFEEGLNFTHAKRFGGSAQAGAEGQGFELNGNCWLTNIHHGTIQTSIREIHQSIDG